MFASWISRWIMSRGVVFFSTPGLLLLESHHVPALLLGPPPGKRKPGEQDEPEDQPQWDEDDFEEIIPGEEVFEDEDWGELEDDDWAELEEEEASAEDEAFAEEEGLPGDGGTDNIP